MASSNSLKVNEGEVVDVEQYETVLSKKGNTMDQEKGAVIGFMDPDSVVSEDGDDLLDPDNVLYEDDDEYNQYDYDYDSVAEIIDQSYLKYQEMLDAKNLPTDVEVSVPWFPGTFVEKAPNADANANANGSNPSLVGEVPVVCGTSSTDHRNVEDYLGKFLFFKRFDTVEDCSDHYYVSKGSSSKQGSKNWAKKIQEEWRALENDLPDTIFIRVYESRIDLLRAVIIGAQGTPYHDGLFFFDVFYPDRYPDEPPKVHYHSGGLRINPNLYECGKVCLSLLGTWAGELKEKWQPGVSTMLQVLVSIQALILNENPYFNEPGYEHRIGTPQGEHQSQVYSENAFLLSLKTMRYNMKRPPKNFEEFVYGHFFGHAHDILAACKAYMNGALVGCPMKNGVEDVEQSKQDLSKRSTKGFRYEVSGQIIDLVKDFTEIGVKDIDVSLKDEAKALNSKGFPGISLFKK